MPRERITILGGGGMGTALGKLAAEAGNEVVVWAREPEVTAEINDNRTNTLFLPGVGLPPEMRATSKLSEALADSELVLSVTPSQVLREVWERALPHLEENAAVVSASKGVETGTGLLMSEVLGEVLANRAPDRLAYLSGPSFAKEFANHQPTAVVVASTSQTLAEAVQERLSTPYFRIYTTDDVIGVELGGALKNVIAIAVGAAEGMGLGFNSRAALITRGLAEVARLAVACGANPLTLSGLSGVGDLLLTCTGHLSRNLTVGIRLGEGQTIDEALAGMKMVAEGVATARSTLDLARKHDVEMPISEVVVQILDGAVTPKDALEGLMGRKLRQEREF